jgi:hypothetical protein
MMLWLRRFVGILLALIILFEEWGWDALQAVAARFARLPPLAWLERRIAALPPYGALAVFFVPALALLPVKIGALWLIGRGHAALGLAVIVAAKVAGTAVLARLFALTQPALMSMPWFARLYQRWTVWKTELLARVRASWAWQQAREIRQRIKGFWRG